MDDKNIVLIGFMGVGKTTVGEMLAERLNRRFLDMDHVIEKETGRSIPDIFAKDGEAAFRNIEKELTINYCRNTEEKVLSLGGGAYMQPEIRKACLENCIVIFLDLSWNVWLERMEELKDSRPLLQEKSVEDIRKLYETRRQTYHNCTYRIPTNLLSPEDVTEKVLEKLM